MATMQVLKSVTAELANISSQHAHQGLLQEELHLDILDQYGGLMPMRQALAARHATMLSHVTRLAALTDQQGKPEGIGYDKQCPEKSK